MNHPARALIVGLVLVLVALGAWHWRDAWWPGRRAVPQATAPADAPATPAAPAEPPAAGPLAGGPPAVRHPIEAASAPPLPEPAPPTLEGALPAVFGREAVATLFQTDNFARRVVATVDALGREKAPARIWPLQPPAGRFTTQRAPAEAGGGPGSSETLAAENFARYARHLAMLEKADPGTVVALYKRFYPQFQQAYEELGYPGRHFNDRLVEVIDLLVATPEPQGPVAVRLPAIQGPLQPQRPWLLYEFADPAQQALPAGPQLMLRMGPENQRRLKVKLLQIRRLLTR